MCESHLYFGAQGKFSNGNAMLLKSYQRASGRPHPCADIARDLRSGPKADYAPAP